MKFEGIILSGTSTSILPIGGGGGVDPDAVDYTDVAWVETDPNGKFSVSVNSILATNLIENEEAYIFKDYGADYFNGDLIHEVDINVASATGSAIAGVWAVTNDVDDFNNIANGPQVTVTAYKDPDSISFTLRNNSAGTQNSISGLSYNTNYYLTIERDHDAGYSSAGRSAIYVYSDAARTILVGTSNKLTGFTFVDLTAQISLQYLGATGSHYQASETDTLTYTISNLTLLGSPSFITAALTGTLADGCNESDIVNGGETIIITLTGGVWGATVGDDNALTTALIAGIDGGRAEATSWDTLIKESALNYTHITRDSDTQITITLPAVPAYSISGNESVVAHIPASCISGNKSISGNLIMNIINGA